MRYIGLCATTLLGVAAMANAADGQQRIVAKIQQDDQKAVDIDMAIPVGESAALVTSSGFRIEVERAAGTAVDSNSTVRLFDDRGGAAKLLHVAKTNETQLDRWTMVYTVCRGSVSFYSPIPDVMPRCNEANGK